MGEWLIDTRNVCPFEKTYSGQSTQAGCSSTRQKSSTGATLSDPIEPISKLPWFLQDYRLSSSFSHGKWFLSYISDIPESGASGKIGRSM